VNVRYDWDRDPGNDSFWTEPIGAAERAFWRGVAVGAVIEAAFVLIVVMAWYWL
jgi:hypothetical protein